jgi:imidazole glycerol phosphate synthase glutamine amidotransferase subunit
MSKKICILDYNAGNVMSLSNAINKVSDYEVKISNNSNDVTNADYLILPGVGSYSYVSNYLSTKNLDLALKKQMLEFNKPVLGICLGMQILFESSTEYGFSKGLGILKGNVKKFEIKKNLPLPNIGWRTVNQIKPSVIFNEGNYYFAHSFHLNGIDNEIIVGESSYGYKFPSVIRRGNFYGVQFHPEKSSSDGLEFLSKFLKL